MFIASWQLQAIAEIERRNRIVNNPPELLWQPNPDKEDGTPNPQRLALESEADELFFGGQAGGGKSDLILGLAFTQHKQSAIFRRVYPNLKSLIQRSIELVGDSNKFNKSDKTWRIDNKIIEFGAVQYEDDKSNWQGRPHDLKAFDEITEFTRSQYLFIIGWNRSTDQSQRCRVVVTGNPPTDDDGTWVIDEWGPWVNPEHPDPAKPGELRWYYYDENNNVVWLHSSDEVEINGKPIKPRSRTFIPSELADNPHLASDGRYESVLQSLPEPLRSQLLYGDFTTRREQDPWQVIPSDWVRLAQKRWLAMDKPDVAISGVGVDVARGGRDKTSIAKRYDNYFSEVISYPGSVTRDGPAVAALVEQNLESEPGYINIDVIGVGSSAYDSLKEMYKSVNPVNVSEKSFYRDRSGRLKMRNKRAEYYWRMRDMLDPNSDSDIALPPGNEVLADLCVARYKLTTAGVTIEDKEAIKKRIGRSPDVGEAILLANMLAYGVLFG